MEEEFLVKIVIGLGILGVAYPIYDTVKFYYKRVDTFDWVERLQRGEELHSGNLFEQREE
tara:strand:- start:50 stop:229 length:180 start_codon:yes stop_codon:yes gene_type:complete